MTSPDEQRVIRDTSLPKDSVANPSQIVALGRGLLLERVGKPPKSKLEAVLAGIDMGSAGSHDGRGDKRSRAV